MNDTTPDEAARRSLLSIAAVFDGAVDAILAIDEAGQVLLANAACERIFGYAPAELVGHNVSRIMPPPHGDAHDGYIARYLETGERRIIGIGREVEGRRKDGTLVPGHLAVSEIRRGDRSIFAGFFRDLSEQRRIEGALGDREAKLSSILDTAVNAIITTDERGAITSVNPACERLFGFTSAELLDKDVQVLFAAPDAAAPGNRLRVYAESEDGAANAGAHEDIGRRRDGSTFDLEISVSQFHAGGRRYFTGILRDITDRKEAQKKLIEQEALVKLGELATIVAHEVKNPLAGILGATRMLQRRLPAGSVENEICGEMVSRTIALSDTVRDILTYARPKTPELRNVPLQYLFDDLVLLVSQDPQFANVAIDAACADIRIVCDVEMIKPVFLNLLVNSAQAMNGDGKVSITAEIESDGVEAELCRIRVDDSGPGIPHEVIDRVFEPFFTTKGSGTGLGLAIARRVITLHHGSIGVECPDGGGTRIVVRLPLAARGA